MTLAEWIGADSPAPEEETANLTQATEEAAEVVAATVPATE